jgi:pyruvate dehydrogenase complex dehydrogenase (E1) component
VNGLGKWQVMLYLTGIFLAGSVSGWVIATKTVKQKAFTAPRMDEIAASMRTCMHSRLQLSDDQKKKIDAIIERSSAEVQAIHRDRIDRIRQVLTERNAQITAVLSAEQQQQFEQIEKERQEQWRNNTNAWRNRFAGRDRHRSPRERGLTNTVDTSVGKKNDNP